jgi:hypothetical protein
MLHSSRGVLKFFAKLSFKKAGERRGLRCYLGIFLCWLWLRLLLACLSALCGRTTRAEAAATEIAAAVEAAATVKRSGKGIRPADILFGKQNARLHFASCKMDGTSVNFPLAIEGVT